MKKSKRRLIGYVLLLALVFTTVFGSVDYVSAATLENIGSQDGVVTAKGDDLTVYTLTKDVVKESTVIEIGLSDGETVVLDGGGKALRIKQLTVRGNGTLVVQNVNIQYGNNGNGMVLSGGIHIIFRGLEPVKIQQRSASSGESASSGAGIYLDDEADARITIEDGANVTLQGGRCLSW